MVKSSLYKNEFLNWGGAKKPLIEKTPQYPYYSLPFRGKSEYKERYKNEEENNKKTKQSKSTPKLSKPAKKPQQQQAALLSSAADIKQRQSNALRLSSLSPVNHDYETTNQRQFQPFSVKERPKTAKPKIDVSFSFR